MVFFLVVISQHMISYFDDRHRSGGTILVNAEAFLMTQFATMVLNKEIM